MYVVTINQLDLSSANTWTLQFCIIDENKGGHFILCKASKRQVKIRWCWTCFIFKQKTSNKTEKPFSPQGCAILHDNNNYITNLHYETAVFASKIKWETTTITRQLKIAFIEVAKHGVRSLKSKIMLNLCDFFFQEQKPRLPRCYGPFFSYYIILRSKGKFTKRLMKL